MDERKLSDLFNDAVGDVPPPSFTEGDVASESARLTRKRNSLVAGTALGFAVLAGGIVVGATLWPDAARQTDTLSAGTAEGPTVPQSVESDMSANSQKAAAAAPEDAPSSAPMQGGTTAADAGPRVSGTPGGCGMADGELATALAGKLPSAVSVAQFVPATLACPTGARAVSFGVQDGQRRGLMSIMLMPTQPPQVLTSYSASGQPGTQAVVVATGSGRQLVVLIEPVAGSPVVDSADVGEIARELAPRF